MSNLSRQPGKGLPRALVCYRASATLLALTTLVQVGLGAGYIGGDYDSMDLHDINARVLISLALLTLGTGIWLRRRGGPVRAAAVSAVLLVALVVQMVLGIERVVAVHITLGVIIFAAVTVLLMRAWAVSVPPKRPTSARPVDSDRPAEPVS
ncbi:hypothetical protein ACFQ7F_20470 [Streptomyces sp. NPDC056486]|uniref:hypothetical protein n=1 Tax=Streptomyces sp. NPDC056486 TaxID=3345835 RepID=UPI0036ACA314